MAGIKEKTAKKIHRSASATASKRGYGKKRAAAYVYGAKRNAGWKPSTQVQRSRAAKKPRHGR